jgi:hypothetical protein
VVDTLRCYRLVRSKSKGRVGVQFDVEVANFSR